MKNTRMKTTLALLTLSTLLVATGAQADWNREGYTYRLGEHAYH